MRRDVALGRLCLAPALGGAGRPGNRAVDAPLRDVVHTVVGTQACDDHFFYRVVAATATQTVQGTLTTLSCTYDVPTTAPWLYVFRQTSGTPDGDLDLRDGADGFLRASGTSTAPGFTQTVTCPPDGSAQNSRAPITYDGRFGPSLSFAPNPADPKTVFVIWDVLSPPPLLDVEQIGPNCTPITAAAGSPFYQTAPIATLASTDPFTLQASVHWTIDAGPASLHSTCSGDVSISLTLQRVQEDGSPLSAPAPRG